MNIRLAKTSDAEAIAPLFNQYREFYKQASDLKGAEAFLKARLENDESIILIAEKNGEFIGFTQLYPTFSSVSMKRIYILNDLFVAPHARAKGAGGQLLSAAKDFAAENGANRLSLQTEHHNRTARSLYEQNGYEEETAFVHYRLNVPAK
ncbi:GNAT family N-acetyltransferase [Bacillus rugosus]|uniref:GNAT family N-acetyltransferase n=1 Tax=Bacillus TaxID=1386 RepID=UPI0014223428|nr:MULTISPECIES: GNAT family N-acetyltransferase [Bacillus]MBY4603310.1 GNAT family N-acetyltransferase [Bacillus sp. SPARC3]MEC1547678.1 GNAT family N-acetyltransferase [Bacillus rugosus]NUF04531.1 GNAT family N-acetyltransferase [Bacillus rugosus]